MEKNVDAKEIRPLQHWTPVARDQHPRFRVQFPFSSQHPVLQRSDPGVRKQQHDIEAQESAMALFGQKVCMILKRYKVGPYQL